MFKVDSLFKSAKNILSALLVSDAIRIDIVYKKYRDSYFDSVAKLNVIRYREFKLSGIEIFHTKESAIFSKGTTRADRIVEAGDKAFIFLCPIPFDISLKDQIKLTDSTIYNLKSFFVLKNIGAVVTIDN